MKNIKIRCTLLIVLMLALAITLTSCGAPSFTDREKYGEYLQEQDYTVYLVSREDATAPIQLKLLCNMIEAWLEKADVPVAKSMLLAVDKESEDVIIVCYFKDVENAQNAVEAIEPYKTDDNSFEFDYEQKDVAVKMNIVLK